ncbi:hypothetical protein [Billgrantia desiderata]|uniref:Uncharacterized protein n=1 Tax=Billgrantia desiderata TaxID=52021 RepID=A0AAW4YYF9_9GAMM|nr:hypothetical protein [Halomonas desiderata]MCE8012148.1 hypothetical protein [Halomonas desiderata]MCE8027977.1 hypothetical protein [Halomonas desiderata]MCE8043167.1 hypothetical protein [Halomonas desiderata]MCE8047736.1 hypothetical protein [Halomonas desiderata]MCE8053524.1 hypothetical protein [Halomonas desiderata]
MQIDATPNAGIQRSLRQCLSNAAFLLYQQGHVLETITIPFRGLDSRALRQMREASQEWPACQRVLESSEAAVYNEHGRFVLSAMGRELLFDMFGQGAADCA